jgi:hypothetical protein
MQFSTLKFTIMAFFPYGLKKLFEVGWCTVQQKLEGQKRWDISLRQQTRCATHRLRIQRGSIETKRQISTQQVKS